MPYNRAACQIPPSPRMDAERLSYAPSRYAESERVFGSGGLDALCHAWRGASGVRVKLTAKPSPRLIKKPPSSCPGAEYAALHEAKRSGVGRRGQLSCSPHEFLGQPTKTGITHMFASPLPLRRPPTKHTLRSPDTQHYGITVNQELQWSTIDNPQGAPHAYGDGDPTKSVSLPGELE